MPGDKEAFIGEDQLLKEAKRRGLDILNQIGSPGASCPTTPEGLGSILGNLPNLGEIGRFQ
jgi:hypothetical protein